MMWLNILNLILLDRITSWPNSSKTAIDQSGSAARAVNVSARRAQVAADLSLDVSMMSKAVQLTPPPPPGDGFSGGLGRRARLVGASSGSLHKTA
ncbi:hypothetical protein ADZ37_15475 [Pannonibacter phragmitetus]|nr:hypothetical protein ADZ37_15475 [Pannonibacter phragmitetus]